MTQPSEWYECWPGIFSSGKFLASKKCTSVLGAFTDDVKSMNSIHVYRPRRDNDSTAMPKSVSEDHSPLTIRPWPLIGIMEYKHVLNFIWSWITFNAGTYNSLMNSNNILIWILKQEPIVPHLVVYYILYLIYINIFIIITRC